MTTTGSSLPIPGMISCPALSYTLYALTHTRIHSLAYPFIHTLTYPLIHPCIHALTHPLIHSLTHPCIRPQHPIPGLLYSPFNYQILTQIIPIPTFYYNLVLLCPHSDRIFVHLLLLLLLLLLMMLMLTLLLHQPYPTTPKGSSQGGQGLGSSSSQSMDLLADIFSNNNRYGSINQSIIKIILFFESGGSFSSF